MRILAILIIVTTSLWGGYWFVGSSALEKNLGAWLKDVQSKNGPLQFSYSGLHVQGFPNRFDTIIDDVDISDSPKSIGWSAQKFRIFALSYKPNHIIAEFPPEQRLTTALGDYSITNDEMRGSVVFKPESALGLDHSAFVISNLRATRGPLSFALKGANFATRQSTEMPLTHDVFFKASDVSFPHDLITKFDPSNQMPGVIDEILVDLSLSLNQPVDRFIGQDGSVKPTQIKLRNSVIKWDIIEVSAKGDLTINATGIPSGTLNLQLKTWRAVFHLAMENGMIDVDIGVATESVLTSLANASGDPDTIDIDLVFKNGQMALGPIPLGPAPRLF